MGSAENLNPRIPGELLKLTKADPTPEIPMELVWGEAPALLSFRIPGVTPIGNQSSNQLYRILFW